MKETCNAVIFAAMIGAILYLTGGVNIKIPITMDMVAINFQDFFSPRAIEGFGTENIGPSKAHGTSNSIIGGAEVVCVLVWLLFLFYQLFSPVSIFFLLLCIMKSL